uniref:helix-turn-helix domain-containing protein n=1 Tax=Nocardia shimofusensis TaxID=228596 RepID=UPI000AF15AFD
MQARGLWTGREVAAFRQALGMSREAFAAHTGVSAEAVRKWERRRQTIQLTAPYAARMDRKLHQADAVDTERFWSILQSTED